METDEISGKEQAVLKLFIHKCPLCDLLFIKEFHEDYHTIVGGYNSKTGAYSNSGKYPTNHMLKCIDTIDLSESDLEDDLEAIVDRIIQRAKEKSAFSKLEPDIHFHTRKIIIRYYAEKAERAN